MSKRSRVTIYICLARCACSTSVLLNDSKLYAAPALSWRTHQNNRTTCCHRSSKFRFTDLVIQTNGESQLFARLPSTFLGPISKHCALQTLAIWPSDCCKLINPRLRVAASTIVTKSQITLLTPNLKPIYLLPRSKFPGRVPCYPQDRWVGISVFFQSGGHRLLGHTLHTYSQSGHLHLMRMRKNLRIGHVVLHFEIHQMDQIDSIL